MGPGAYLAVQWLRHHLPVQVVVGLTPVQFCSVQLLNCVWLFMTPWTAAHHASLSITNSWSLLKLMSIESVMPSNHLILCCPLLFPPSSFPSIRVFSDGSVLRIRWPEYWSFSFSINPSNEYSGLISFRVDWLDLPAVRGTPKSLLQQHSSKVSILWCSALFYLLFLTIYHFFIIIIFYFTILYWFCHTSTWIHHNSHIHTWLLEKP